MIAKASYSGDGMQIDKRDLYFTALMYFILGAVVGFVLLPLVI
jgi:hypothetical protein